MCTTCVYDSYTLFKYINIFSVWHMGARVSCINVLRVRYASATKLLYIYAVCVCCVSALRIYMFIHVYTLYTGSFWGRSDPILALGFSSRPKSGAHHFIPS